MFKKLYNEVPKCAGCLPDLLTENILIYETYRRVYNSLDNICPFTVMKMIGIKKQDHLYCLDIIQSVRNEVLRVQNIKRGIK